MAREGLKLELATSMRKAPAQKTEIRTEHVPVKSNGEYQLINLVVKPVSQPTFLEG
jgi:two-component system CheB/CheR fusion protein